MNKRVYFISFVLVLLAAVIISIKIIYGGLNVTQEASRNLWRIQIVMNITGKGDRSSLRLILPQDNDHQKIYNEHFENDDMDFYIRNSRTGNRLGYWKSEILDGTRSAQYRCSVQLKKLIYQMPPDLELPRKPEEFYPPEMKPWLDPSKYIQSQDVSIKKHLKDIIKRDKNIPSIMRKLFDFVRLDVEYKSEMGSKDAKDTLKKLEADCGGKARLFAALARAAGIPTRLVGGIVLSPGVKNITHVWIESFIGGKWVPFDAVNNHFAEVPNNYLEIYRGDYSLIRYSGLEKIDYYFAISKERIPPIDSPWSLYILPIHFQSFIKVLLLIPLGALVVAFFRTIIGVPTFGTFAPVLLALAFREISLLTGLACIVGVIVLGWLFRSFLDKLKILVIPRLSIIVTLVVILVLVMVVVFYHLGIHRILFITLFPMIIMTWTIERFSVIQIEDGTKAAFQAALGTALVAAAAYYLMEIKILRVYLFAFPELLLVIMAIMLLLGRYTGIRLAEFWRFREFLKLKK